VHKFIKAAAAESSIGRSGKQSNERPIKKRATNGVFSSAKKCKKSTVASFGFI
jgi:hypothetical protein